MKRVFFVIILVSSLLIINNLVRSIYTLWQKQDLVRKAQLDLAEKKKQNQVLKKKVSEVKSPSFIEREARNKLFLVKKDETELILPQHLLESTASAKTKEDTRPNWQKWLNLFF